MGLWISVIAAVVVIVVALALTAIRRRRGAPSGSGSPSSPPSAPMNDLESALSRVTDRNGRPLREKIDAEAVHVDPLRDPDDTGPLLRRALDSVAHHDEDHHDGSHHDGAHHAGSHEGADGGSGQVPPPTSP